MNNVKKELLKLASNLKLSGSISEYRYLLKLAEYEPVGVYTDSGKIGQTIRGAIKESILGALFGGAYYDTSYGGGVAMGEDGNEFANTMEAHIDAITNYESDSVNFIQQLSFADFNQKGIMKFEFSANILRFLNEEQKSADVYNNSNYAEEIRFLEQHLTDTIHKNMRAGILEGIDSASLDSLLGNLLRGGSVKINSEIKDDIKGDFTVTCVPKISTMGASRGQSIVREYKGKLGYKLKYKCICTVSIPRLGANPIGRLADKIKRFFASQSKDPKQTK